MNRIETINPEKRILDLNLQQRLIRAHEYQKIILDKKPDFVGNFSTNYNHSGLFEMFINPEAKDQFIGTIEDCFGTASFAGEVTPDKISFIKKYISKQSAEYCIPTDILYEGYSCRDNGISYYFGTWRAKDCTNERDQGYFILKKDDLNFIYQERYSSPNFLP